MTVPTERETPKIEHDGVGHKIMQGGEPFVLPPELSAMGNIDLRSNGGVLVNSGGKPEFFVRPPFWRAKKYDPMVRQEDVKPLYGRRELSDQELGTNSLDVGGELELLFWNREEKEVYRVMTGDSPVIQKLIDHNNGLRFHQETDVFSAWPDKIAFSPEFIASVCELNFPHAPNSLERGIQQLRVLQIVDEAANDNGALIVPISAFSHRPLLPGDTHPHPYIERVAFEYMGWERVKHFVGNSWQVHVEMLTLDSALAAINYLQQITPIIHSLTLASPFIDGKIFLSDQNLPGLGIEPSTWQSVRYLARYVGSPSGGVIRQPFPEKENDFWVMAAEMLASGEIPSPARTGGHHVDFRIRPDLPPYGTIEITFMDTAGACPLKLLALQEFLRVVCWKLQRIVIENNRGELPNLFFGDLTPERLLQLHNASIAVSKDGMKSSMTAGDGFSYPVETLWRKLVEWIDSPKPDWEYHGLSPGVIMELNKSSTQVTHEDLKPFENREGIPSVYGYYRTGLGTLSQWLLARAERLIRAGESEFEAIVNCLGDLGSSYHHWLHHLTPNDIKQLLCYP